VLITTKFALGTAQFGSNYGIANQTGKPTKRQIFGILKFAHQQGIDTLDTADHYGDSEKIISQFISQTKLNFKIISKFSQLEKVSNLNGRFSLTLKKLQQKKLYSYFVWDYRYLIKFPQLYPQLQKLKQKKLIKKIGISLYSPRELKIILKKKFHFDLIQLPYNFFDQRFEKHFFQLKKQSVEIHIRSVFLQGLFFLPLKKINQKFPLAKTKIKKLHQLSTDHKIPLAAICLCFAHLNPLIDKVIIGVDSIEQLKENLDSLQYLKKVKQIYPKLKSLKLHQKKILLPYLWK
jgi:aryl-alcohol dehydrogenase-like predicted oxidoreductase